MLQKYVLLLLFLVSLLPSCRQCLFKEEPRLTVRFFAENLVTFQRVYGLDGTQVLPDLGEVGAFMELPLALDRDSVVFVFEQLTPETRVDTLVLTYERKPIYESRCGFVMKFEALSINENETTYQDIDTLFLDRYEININL